MFASQSVSILATRIVARSPEIIFNPRPLPPPDKATLTASWDTDLSKVVFAALHATSFIAQHSDDGGVT